MKLIKNNEANKSKEMYKNNNNLKELDFLEYFFSEIAFIMQEIENSSNANYSTLHQFPIIKSEQIIEFIL